MFHGGFQSRFLLLPMKNRDSRQSGLFNKVYCFCRIKPPPTPPNLGGEQYRSGQIFASIIGFMGQPTNLNIGFNIQQAQSNSSPYFKEGQGVVFHCRSASADGHDILI